MKTARLVASFLEEIAEILDAFSEEARSPAFNVSVGVACSIVLSVVASFSRNLVVPFAILVFSFILALTFKLHISKWIKPGTFVAFIALFVALPLFVLSGGVTSDKPSYYSLALFILRPIASSAIFTVIFLSIGLSGFLEGLLSLHAPRELIDMIWFFIRYMQLFLRDACRLLAARESRIISDKCGYRKLWWIIGTVVGEMLLRSYAKAAGLNLALQARNFGESVRHSVRGRISKFDAFLFFTCILFVALECVCDDIVNY